MTRNRSLRSASIAVLLAGVALAAASCAQKQTPPISEEKPVVEQPAAVEDQPQPQPEPQPQTVAPPTGPSEEMGPTPHAKTKHKAKKSKAHRTTKQKGKHAEKEAAGGNESIMAELQNAGSFKTFTRLVKAAGLSKWLRSKGAYTVLAPTDAAFAKLPARTVDDMLKSKNKRELQNFVFSHTLKGRLNNNELKNLKAIQTWNGQMRKVHVEGEKVVVGKANLAKREIIATNGIIHPINQVFIGGSGRGESHKSGAKSSNHAKSNHKGKSPAKND